MYKVICYDIANGQCNPVGFSIHEGYASALAQACIKFMAGFGVRIVDDESTTVYVRWN
jgi:hypothetical protein